MPVKVGEVSYLKSPMEPLKMIFILINVIKIDDMSSPDQTICLKRKQEEIADMANLIDPPAKKMRVCNGTVGDQHHNMVKIDMQGVHSPMQAEPIDYETYMEKIYEAILAGSIDQNALSSAEYSTVYNWLKGT